MMENRIKNSGRNLIWMMIGLLITSLMPFAIRTLMVHYIGIEYTGVSNLFTSVLQILSVADLGLENALSFYLYKIMADKDYEDAGVILGYFRKLYLLAGGLIVALGVALIPIVPYMVKGRDYPSDINIYVIYIIYILNASLPYLFGYVRAVVFKSDQRTDIVYKIGCVTALIMYSLQIIVICQFRNYYIYSILLLMNAILLPVSLSLYSRRFYPQIVCHGNPDREFRTDLKKRLVAMFFSKIRNISRNSFDSVVISVFLGLVMLAKYQNYYQVMLVPNVIISIFHGAVGPSFGNGVALESTESNYGVLKLYSFVMFGVNAVCCSCLINLFQPFMTLWMGKQFLLPFDMVVLFCVYYYAVSISDITVLLREVTGIWWEGRYVAIVEVFANLFLNVLLVKKYGVSGVVIATILTVVFINIPCELYFVFRYYFKEHLRTYSLMQIKYAMCTFIITVISYYLCSLIVVMNIQMMILKIIVAVVVPLFVFLLINCNNSDLRNLILILNNMVRNKTVTFKQ